MPKHLSVGANVINRTAYFDRSKVARVYYNAVFPKVPFVSLTIDDESSVPVRRLRATKTYVDIKFKNRYTGTVDVQITER